MASLQNQFRPKAVPLALAAASGLLVAVMAGVAFGCSDEGAAALDNPPFSYQVQRFLKDVKDTLLFRE